MKPRCDYEISTRESTPETLVIRDLNAGALSVTNDAENVVAELYLQGHLNPTRQLHYYDSDGDKDGIAHANGRFTGFYFLPRN